jgi:outer membrane receptor protein involved in Fe transport
VDAAGIVRAAAATGILSGGRLTQVPYSSVFENQGDNQSYSVFADVTWIPTPRLELTAGVRLLIEERKSGFFARVPRPVLNPTAFSLIPGQVDTGGQTFEAERSYEAVLPRFNLLYRVNDDINLFATVSKGRRSPVVQLNAVRVGAQPRSNLQLVPEEIVWNYEVGAKAPSASCPARSASITRSMTAFRSA